MCKIENIKTVFVDIDDTVWWTAENSKVALRELFSEFGLGSYCGYADFYESYISKNNELWGLYHQALITTEYLKTERFAYVLRLIGWRGDVSSMSVDLNERYLDLLSQKSLLLPGAREMMEYLWERYDVNALSNGFKSVQERKLRAGGILQYVNRLILSEDCGITKPLPGIFEYALRECNAEASTTVMIGDNYDADIVGAHNAGWRTIFFNLKGVKLGRTVADVEVANLVDIVGNGIL